MRRSPLLVSYLAAYWPTLRLRWSRRTAGTNASILRCHIAPTLRRVRLDEITSATLSDLAGSLVAGGLSPTTANNALKLLRVILADAQTRGLVRSVPKARRLREPEAVRGASREDISRYLAAFDAAPSAVRASAPFFRLIAATGLRFGDAHALRVGDVDLVARVIRIRQRKTGRLVVVPLSADALDAVREAIAGASPDGRLFVAGASTLARYHAVARKLAALPCLTIHGLRHAYAARLAEAGLSAFQLRDVLGHATARMSERYIAAASREASADAARAILDSVQTCSADTRLRPSLEGSEQCANRVATQPVRLVADEQDDGDLRAHGARIVDPAPRERIAAQPRPLTEEAGDGRRECSREHLEDADPDEPIRGPFE